MSDSKKPRYKLAPMERFNQLIERPELITTICANISMGGSLNKLCEEWGVNPGLLTTWINDHPIYAEKLKKAYDSRMEWVREEIFSEMKNIALSDIRQIYDDDGNIKHPTKWPKHVASAVQSIDEDELWEGRGAEREQTGVTKKIKFYDKVKALQTLGKEVGMFGDKDLKSGLETLADALDKTWGRGDNERD